MPICHQTPFILLVGMMGVGKSSLSAALAKRIHARCFLEPEADAWPIDPNNWEAQVSELEAWVRKTSLDNVINAHTLSRQGITSISDSGLFLLTKECIDDPSCQFYFGLMTEQEKIKAREHARRDWDDAPVPDILILIEADLTCWKKFLLRRGRHMDNNPGFIASFWDQQHLIRQTATKYANEKNITFVSFKNNSNANIQSLTEELLSLLPMHSPY